MAAPTKVGHVGKQPTSLDGGLGSVSRISMATQITPGSRKKCHATSNSILTVSCGLKRQRSVRQAAMMKTERLGSESSPYRGGAKHHGMMTSSRTNQNTYSGWLPQSPSLKESTKPNITQCQMSRTLITNLLH